MSKMNKRRRREKQMRRARADRQAVRNRGRPQPSPRGAPEVPRHLIKEMIVSASNGLLHRDRVSFETLVDGLDEVSSRDDDCRRVVDEEITTCLGGAVALAWQRGWQPADVTRLVARHLDPVHLRLAVGTIALDRLAYEGRPVDPRWDAQLDDLKGRGLVASGAVPYRPVATTRGAQPA